MLKRRAQWDPLSDDDANSFYHSYEPLIVDTTISKCCPRCSIAVTITDSPYSFQKESIGSFGVTSTIESPLTASGSHTTLHRSDFSLSPNNPMQVNTFSTQSSERGKSKYYCPGFGWTNQLNWLRRIIFGESSVAMKVNTERDKYTRTLRDNSKHSGDAYNQLQHIMVHGSDSSSVIEMVEIDLSPSSEPMSGVSSVSSAQRSSECAVAFSDSASLHSWDSDTDNSSDAHAPYKFTFGVARLQKSFFTILGI